MYIKDFLEKMTNIQQNLLGYFDDENDSEDEFQKIKDILTKNIIKDSKYELKPFLYLLSKICNNHQRSVNFFNKIERIIKYLKDDLQKHFSSLELFHIFKNNKRILLFLVESKMMIIDKLIFQQINEFKYSFKYYSQYFYPEIEPFISENNYLLLEIENGIPENFYEKRKIGENGNFICQLIRKDSLDDFIVYINKHNYQFDTMIYPSIYETNYFLLKKSNSTIIEYAAFFGSIQIFNYLKNNGAELTPSLWNYAIHGRNSEIIQILEENQIKPEDESYKQIFKESIKCHHNEIADYIKNNYLVNENKEKEEEDSKYEIIYGLKYSNFNIIKKQINETAFNYLCKYDYYTLVSILLNTINIDINHKTIYQINHFNSIFN